MLLANNAEVDVESNFQQTPLHIASEHGNRDVAELLLAHGADVNAEDKHGETPFYTAKRFGKEDVMDLLHEWGASVERPLRVFIGGQEIGGHASSPSHPIHDAAQKGDLEKVKSLLKIDPDLVFSKKDDGETPLHVAARSGQKGIVELLLASPQISAFY